MSGHLNNRVKLIKALILIRKLCLARRSHFVKIPFCNERALTVPRSQNRTTLANRSLDSCIKNASPAILSSKQGLRPASPENVQDYFVLCLRFITVVSAILCHAYIKAVDLWCPRWLGYPRSARCPELWTAVLKHAASECRNQQCKSPQSSTGVPPNSLQ